MKTEILSGDEGIALGVKLIWSENIVAFSTETVYGLGGSAYSDAAVAKIYEAKGRPGDNPLICHIPSVTKLETLARFVPDEAYKLFAAFSPGPLTVILPKNKLVSDKVSAGLDSVGVRIPSNPTALRFLDACELPIAAPSANKSTRLSPTDAMAVFEDMDGRIPLIIDGGSSSVGIESTVISVITEKPTILRPGIITLKMLQSVLPETMMSRGGSELMTSPGTRHPHYKPLVELVVARSLDAVNMLYAGYAACGIEPVVVGMDSLGAELSGRNFVSVGMTDKEVARNIFSTLRVVEKKFGAIICQDFSDTDVGYSVMNRVNRAAKNNT